MALWIASLGMMVDHLEFGACDLELVCTLYLVPWDFRSSSLVPPPGALAPFEKETSGYWGFVRHSVGKSCPALSSEPGLILLAAQVVRGSVGLGFVTLVVHPSAVPLDVPTCDEFLKFQISSLTGLPVVSAIELAIFTGRPMGLMYSFVQSIPKAL